MLAQQGTFYLLLLFKKIWILAVVVRDLFYNQPVRRKFIQSSSPKKVVQSVKKCVLQVALVHSRVSFEIIDIESEKVLLSTYRSSAMSILMSDYGIDEVKSLHKINVSDGFLSLSGYITCPSDDFSPKAFQYVYINSRFVFKGPIHKLLNHLAMTFEVLDSSGAMSEKGKRSQTQACIAYIMNLYCPRDLYDLTLETSKTYADFKDWGPILTFIQKAVQQVWSKIVAGEYASHRVDLHSTLWKGNDDMMSTKEVLPETSEVASDKFQRPQYHAAYSPLERLKKHPDETFNGDYNKAAYQEFEVDFSELKEQVETRYPYQSDFSILDVADCGNIPLGTLACNSNLLPSHNSFDLPDDILQERHDIMQTHSGDLARNHLSSVWQNDSSKIESPKMEFSSDHKAWRKQLETSVRGNNRYRNGGDSTLQEFEVDVCDFNDEVEMRCAYQSGFSIQSKDVTHRERTLVMPQEYCSPVFTARNSFEFSDDKFIEDRDNIRQKYSDDIEGNPLSSNWKYEFPKYESANIPLFSDHEMWHKQLKFGEGGRVPVLHGCSFRRSVSCNKGLVNSQEEAEDPISESHYSNDKFLEDTRKDRHKYNDDMVGNLISSDWHNEYLINGSANNISSSGHEVWSKQLKIGESAKDHFCCGRSPTRSLSRKGLLNRGEETEVTIAEPHVKRRRVCFNKNIDVIEDEINNQRDDIFLGQGEQTFTQDALLEACWGVKNFPRDITDEVSRGEKGENHCHLVGSKAKKTHWQHMSGATVDWLQLDLQSQDQNSYDKYSEKWDKLGYQSGKKDLLSNYSRRSHSAPPFHRQKRKFVSSNGSLSVGRKPQAHVVHDQENKITYLEPNSIRKLHSTTRPEMKHEQSTVSPIEEGLEVKMVGQQCMGHNSADFTSSGRREVEHIIKWRNSSQENRTARDGDSHHSILDITSEFSNLTGSVLIPESLRKNCLKQAKVLQQVDKKFIPVVGDGTLAVIDQQMKGFDWRNSETRYYLERQGQYPI
ncbi:DNA mismatch repair protein MLH3 [Linum grandiflorum]